MSEWKAKRFWEIVEVVETAGGYGITLDGRPVKTPAKQALEIPTRALANAIASEWDAQEELIDPNAMPFTRTANSALDKVAVQQAEVADMLADYGDSDLLCYRADGPEALISRQAAAWDPMLDWAADEFSARLEPRTGVMHTPQDPEAIANLRRQVHQFGAFELAAFHDLVSLTGSLVLGFAAAHNIKTPEYIWKISRIDEDWQEEQWGVDEEAAKTTEIKQTAFVHAYGVYRLCHSETAC